MFPGQDDTEIIQRVVYMHPMAVFPYIGVSIVLFILGLIAVYLGASGIGGLPETNFTGFSQGGLNIPLAPIGFGMVGLAFFMAIASIYIWRQNKLIVTSENIVDVDQVGLFQKTISTLRLSRVQDITVSVKGPMQTIFGYGTIIVQTAGERENFLFEYVPLPYDVKAFIVDIYERFVETKPHETDGLLRQEHEPDPDGDNQKPKV